MGLQLAQAQAALIVAILSHGAEGKLLFGPAQCNADLQRTYSGYILPRRSIIEVICGAYL
jgi:hypothetical protein